MEKGNLAKMCLWVPYQARNYLNDLLIYLFESQIHRERARICPQGLQKPRLSQELHSSLPCG